MVSTTTEGSASFDDSDTEKQKELEPTHLRVSSEGADSQTYPASRAATQESVFVAAVTGDLANETPVPPPNGGLFAWLQVLGSFFAFFNCWGIIVAFGSYQTYYEEHLLQEYSPSVISWVGSVQGFLTVMSMLFFGRMIDAGYLRTMLIGGTFMMVFGMMMTSLSSKFYQIFLAQGVCLGIGSSAIFAGSVTVVASYFTTKRSTAIGLVASGSSIGGVIWPIAVSNLINTVGFAWSCRIVGFMMLATMSIPCTLLRSRVPPRKSGSIVDIPSLTDWPFVIFSFGLLVGFMGIYIPQFYLESYSKAKGVPDHLVFYMLTIMNAGSILGRIVPNFTADKIGSLNIVVPFVFISGILAFCWMRATSTGGIIVFSIFYGFFSGAFVSMPPACFASMTAPKDINKLGTRIGMGFSLSSLGMVSGNPIAGALINAQGGYSHAQVFCGALVMGSAALCLAAKWKLNPRLTAKV